MQVKTLAIFIKEENIKKLAHQLKEETPFL